jgi:hypothetical protein
MDLLLRHLLTLLLPLYQKKTYRRHRQRNK